MKHTNNLQRYTEPDKTISGQSLSSQTAREPFCLPDSYRPEKLLLPAIKADTFRYESPVKKMNFYNKTFHPFPNVYLKETAARLSDIELAIDNYDALMFQCAIHSLAGLFSNMNMPAAIRITRQMEEMAAENRMQDVTDQLQLIKKIIAEFVKARNRKKI